MRHRLDARDLDQLSHRLGEAALNPTLWPEIMEAICRAAGATGALLLQGDVPTADVPCTPSIAEGTEFYFKHGRHLRDPRSRGIPLWASGQHVVVDQDVLTPEEIRRHPHYNEVLRPFGFQWFAGIGFRSGLAMWVLAIQRTIGEGPFEAEDKRLLGELSPHLGAAATLSAAIGRITVTGMTDALDLVQKPALAVDRMGFVLGTNGAAEAQFDDEICVRYRRLFVRDRVAAANLTELFDRIRTTADEAVLPAAPIVVRRDGKPSLLLRALPIGAVARRPFLGARALLTLTELRPKPAPNPDVVARAFGLTRAEARLAALLAGGMAPDAAAQQLGISRETVRSQLKAVFAKTETHRQSELTALLAQVT